MVEEFTNKYAALFKNTQLPQENTAIIADVEDMLARLDEFETILTNVKEEIGNIKNNELRDILFFVSHFDDMCHKIDNMEIFIQSMLTSLDEVERMTLLAEETLNPNEYGLKNFLFKPLLNKS